MIDRFHRYCHRTGTDSSGRPLNHNVFYFIIYSSFTRSMPTAHNVYCASYVIIMRVLRFLALSDRLIAQQRHADLFISYRTVESIIMEPRHVVFLLIYRRHCSTAKRTNSIGRTMIIGRVYS